MPDPTTRDDPTAGDCTTTGSFSDHGLEDGSALVRRTYYGLADPESPTFEPTAAFFDRLEAAFVRAYLDVVGEEELPDHVAAAVDDARALTAEEFADDPDADLRTEVIPAFYRRVAGFHCAYRE